MDFEVDCETWKYGGNGNGAAFSNPTYLLDKHNKMCCLGHCAVNIGINKDIMLNIGTPVWLRNTLRRTNGDFSSSAIEYFDIFIKINKEEGIQNNDFAQEATVINDNGVISHRQRISDLQKLFKEHGHTITFINQYSLSDEGCTV